MKGRVRYENVSGDGYVEMWNVFANGRYFTRTIGDQGPMRTITGNSDWRSIVLPFDATRAEAPPERLIINVVLPGRGEVTLVAMTLVELEPGEWRSGVNDSAQFDLWGGIAGATFGVFGGLLGWLGGLGEGEARRLNWLPYNDGRGAGSRSFLAASPSLKDCRTTFTTHCFSSVRLRSSFRPRPSRV